MKGYIETDQILKISIKTMIRSATNREVIFLIVIIVELEIEDRGKFTLKFFNYWERINI